MGRWKFQVVKNYLQEIKKDLRHHRLEQAQQTTETLIDYHISHNQSITQAQNSITVHHLLKPVKEKLVEILQLFESKMVEVVEPFNDLFCLETEMVSF